MTKNLLARLGPVEYRELIENVETSTCEQYGLRWKIYRRGRFSQIGKTFWISSNSYQSAQVLLILAGKWPGNEHLIATRIDTSLGWNTPDNLQWSERGHAITSGHERKRLSMIRSILGSDEPDLGLGFRLGPLCKNNHRWNDLALTLQYMSGENWRCKLCEQERHRNRSRLQSRIDYQKKWYQTNIKEQQRKARERMALRAQNLTEEQKHRQRTTGIIGAHRRRALERQVTIAKITRNQIRDRFQQFGNACAYCGNGNSLQVEHVVPISRGGTNTLGNIIPACSRCNANKHANEVYSWYKCQDFYSEKRWQKICRVLGWSRSSVGQLALL